MAETDDDFTPEFDLSGLFSETEKEIESQIKAPNQPSDDEEFDRLLNEFINSELSDVELDVAIEEKKEDISQNRPAKPKSSQKAPVSSLLCEEEHALFSAYENFVSSINLMASQFDLPAPLFNISAEQLYPRYKPKISSFFIEDSIKGWEIMLNAHGADLKNLNPDASDDDLLNFAEQTDDETLQLALISYVEILIELEGCEIAYEDRRIKAKKRMIERQIIEEHEARQKKIKAYIARIEEQKFPINSERLVVNYFKTARKDPDGAREILVNNPATYTPIEVSKIPSRLFGLIKSKPEDGIRYNKIIGNFLKKLRA